MGLLNGITRYHYAKARNNQFKCILADRGFESKKLVYQLQKLGFTLYPMKSTKRLKKGTIYNKDQNNLHPTKTNKYQS